MGTVSDKRTAEQVPEVHHDHRDVSGGWLRPTVFGAMDGLVSNFSLMAGMSGGSDSTRVVVLAGLAGLAAGAFSMAAGEYTSVASQAELANAEIEVERREIAEYPAAELAELISRCTSPAGSSRGSLPRSRGRSPPTRSGRWRSTRARNWESRRASCPRRGSRRARPSSRSRRARRCRCCPYAFGADGLAPSVAVTLAALFGCGALVSRVTTRSWWYSGSRQAVLGAAAAAVTYGGREHRRVLTPAAPGAGLRLV